MEIHSSSLTFSPIGYNRQQVGKNHQAQDKNETNQPSVAKELHNSQFSRTPSPKEAIESLDNAALSLDVINRYDTYKPTDARILKALNAYNQEINQPLDQGVELIAGIDAYA